MKAITTKYHGPTDTRGSRITASDEDGNRVTVSIDHSLNSDDNHDAAAKALCIKMGWTRHSLASGGTKTGKVYVFVVPSDFIAFTDAEREAGTANEIKRSAAWRKDHGVSEEAR